MEHLKFSLTQRDTFTLLLHGGLADSKHSLSSCLGKLDE